MDFSGTSAWLAQGGGLGLVPWVPGTAGALAGLGLALVLDRLRPGLRIAAVLALVVLAVPVCHYGSEAFQAHDDARIVADELLTFPVATVAWPVRRHPAVLAGVFIVSRVLDWIKPFPVNAAEDVSGGLGIVLDDVAANVYALVLGVAACAWLRRRGMKGSGSGKRAE